MRTGRKTRVTRGVTQTIDESTMEELLFFSTTFPGHVWRSGCRFYGDVADN